MYGVRVSEQPPNGNGILTANDVTALVSLMSGMLDRMEGRIIGRLDDNSRLASERWQKHDSELEANPRRVVARFEAIEAELLTVSQCLKAHLDKEHDEQVAVDARVRPVKTVLGFVVANWKSIALAILALAGIVGWAGLETHIIGR